MRRLDEQGAERSLVRAVVAMANDMDVDVVAEGIETIAQLTTLQSLGCRYGQGFLFSRAVSPEEARSMVESRPFGAYGSGDAVTALTAER